MTEADTCRSDIPVATGLIIEEVVREDPEKEKAKLRALMGGKDGKVAGQRIYPFSAGRKVALSITDNEFYNARKWIEQRFEEKDVTVPDEAVEGGQRRKTYADVTNEEFAALCEQTIPQFELHVGAFAYICCHNGDTLADVTADPKQFRKAVMRWLCKLNSDQLKQITTEAVKRLGDETIGQDFEVVETENEDDKLPN